MRASLCRTLLGASLSLACLPPLPAGAQEEAAACPQGRISSIFVDNHSVFDLSDPDLNQRFGWAYRLANSLHVATREEVIRREILVSEGDCYEIERLRDSERLLRLLPFLADVDIFGVRQQDGTVHVIVDTQDDWSTRVQVKVGSGGTLGLEGLRLREDNLLGTGQQVAAFYINDEERQVYGASFYTPQLFGTRWDAGLDVGRTPVGFLVSEMITYPFVGEFGRWGIRQSVLHEDHFFEYWVPRSDGGLAALWFPERRQSVELGFAYRRGSRGFNRTLLGAALLGEWVTYPEQARFADPDAWPGGSPPPVPGVTRDSVSNLRAMFMTGQRNVYYVRRRALNTVNGTEDVRLGVEAEAAIGPSLPGLSRDRDLALDLNLYAAGEFAGSTLAGLNLAVQGRRNYETPADRSEWRDVYAQLRAWSYWRPAPDSRHTLVGSVTAAGGWHTVTPFQLTLGEEVGLRGYPRHLDPGGRRIVASLEHRSYLGWPLPQLFDLGGVAFVDVGRIWAGDVPFGVDSPVRANVGLGLRAAFPPGSRRAFRVDVGVPIDQGLNFRGVVLSVGMGQLIGSGVVASDPQLGRSVRRGISSSAFVYPFQP